ncbi:MAG: hypothetical protein AAF281_08290 [Pseudomonadota bacterium]
MADMAEGIIADVTAISAISKDFIAEFFYAPIGIEPTPLLINATLLALVFLASFLVYRLVKPAPRKRYRARTSYDYGRNS